jgi:hypothetical protein
MKKITVLGSTGSIGVNALDVIEKNPGQFRVVALAAGNNIKLLQKQIEKFRPKIVGIADKDKVKELCNCLSSRIKTKIVAGTEGLKEVASFTDADIVVSAISGAAGLIPTLAAVNAKKDIALANKETMVMAGDIVTKKAKRKGVNILPVDSEHSAIFQCLQGQKRKNINKIILTASGGPFFKYNKSELGKEPGGYVDFDNWTVDEPRARGIEREVPIGKTIVLTSGADGSFLTADAQNNKLINIAGDANKPAPQNAKFQIIDLGLGRVALKAANGKFVSVAGPESVVLKDLAGAKCGDAESFQWVNLMRGDTMLMVQTNHQYLATKPNSPGAVTANALGASAARKSGAEFKWKVVE